MAPPAAAILRIVEGDVEVSDRDGVAIATVVGSCVAACLWDPVRQAGGMNHFLLPDPPLRPPGRPEPDEGAARRYGAHLMELLINRLMGMGAQRARLRAKVFGGAAMASGLTDAGARNAAFVQGFLAREGIPLIGGSLGGTSGRRVEFWPVTGRARLRLTGIEAARPPTRLPALAGGEPEFF